MATTTAHTPGPWLHGKTSDEIITPKGIGVAAPCDGYDEDQWAADATLIAAAPDLLDALKTALRLADLQGQPRVVGIMQAAVAKAEGR